MESFRTFGTDFPEELSTNRSLQQWACLTLRLMPSNSQADFHFLGTGALPTVYSRVSYSPTNNLARLAFFPPRKQERSSKRPSWAELQSKERGVLEWQVLSLGLSRPPCFSRLADATSRDVLKTGSHFL